MNLWYLFFVAFIPPEYPALMTGQTVGPLYMCISQLPPTSVCISMSAPGLEFSPIKLKYRPELGILELPFHVTVLPDAIPGVASVMYVLSGIDAEIYEVPPRGHIMILDTISTNIEQHELTTSISNLEITSPPIDEPATEYTEEHHSHYEFIPNQHQHQHQQQQNNEYIHNDTNDNTHNLNNTSQQLLK